MEYSVLVSSVLRMLIEEVNEKLNGLMFKDDNYFQAIFKGGSL